MLFLRVLLFLTLGTFTLAVPVSPAPVSTHPHPPRQWRTITSSPQNDVIEQNFGERVADYWYLKSLYVSEQLSLFSPCMSLTSYIP